ncbi:flavin-containing amine oxidoreductase, partial [Pelagibacteraceae bacterium]|nr:flavin-containing amine oxidoreductase [Pelagibacteraceae bacterium]
PENSSNQFISLDLGFIVFNKITYPKLLKFFNDLEVKYEKSDMSFTVSVKNSSIEYSGSGLSGLFSNKLNIFNINFLKMIKEIISFYKKAEKISSLSYENKTLGDFLKSQNFSNYFINFHILPMVAAIWSVPPSLAKKMPMNLFLNFFKNHGLFKIKNRPQWFTVSGRSKTYVNKILQTISGEYFKNYEIKGVQRNKNYVRLYYGSSNEYFDYDKVIFATHADETLRLIKDPTKSEKSILENFKYKKNIAYLHSDENLMPKRKNAWSSWNSILDKEDISKNCVTYWLNKLQNLKTKNNYFLTLNPFVPIKNEKIIKEIKFSHPFYDLQTLKYQKHLKELQGVNNTWFCGSYFGYGFHEDGLKSSLDIVDKI